MNWPTISGKQEWFATWNTRFAAYAQTKETFESLTGTALEPMELIEPYEPEALGDTLANEQREVHRVATESNCINGEQFQEKKNSAWCMLALTLEPTKLMVILHDCLEKDGPSDWSRA